MYRFSSATASGFTLIEVLLYMTILGLMATGFVTGSMALQDSEATIHHDATVLQEREFIFEYLERIIEDSDDINTPGEGESSPILSVRTTYDTTRIFVSSSTLMTQYADIVEPLHSPTSRIVRASFSRIQTPDDPEHITSVLTFQSYVHGRWVESTSTRTTYRSL